MKKSSFSVLPHHILFGAKANSLVKPAQLERQTTVAMRLMRRGTSIGDSMTNYEDEKNKVLHRFVDLLVKDEPSPLKRGMADSDLSEQTVEDLEKILNEEEDANVSEQESYWALEMDEFGFENMTFSIAKQETIRLQESRILNQVVWNYKHREKAVSRAITRMETMRSFVESPPKRGSCDPNLSKPKGMQYPPMLNTQGGSLLS